MLSACRHQDAIGSDGPRGKHRRGYEVDDDEGGEERNWRIGDVGRTVGDLESRFLPMHFRERMRKVGGRYRMGFVGLEIG